MRLWILTFLSFTSFNLFSQSEKIPSLWFSQKTDSTWILFTLEDSLKAPVRVDSVVVSSYANFYEMAVITIDKGKYGLFSCFTESHAQFKHEYDSIFVHQGVLLFSKNGNWSLSRITDFFNSESTRTKVASQQIGSVDSFFVNQEGVFYWQNGLQGLISGTAVISPKYKYVRNYSSEYEVPIYLLSDGIKVGLFKDGKEVLPVQFEAIEHYKYGWMRFWMNESDTAGYWNYLSPDNRIIATNNCDLRVYSEDVYKLYNSDRSQSRVFINHQELNAGFEDYFLLNREMLAVKKNGKIGLISKAGRLFFEPKYDQIEILTSDRLRVLKDQSWFLADFNGNILSDKGFGAILYFQSNIEFSDGVPSNIPYFSINTSNGMGVLNNDGKVIIAPNYLKISKMGAFFVAYNGTNVVYNKLGKRVSNKIYPYYSNNFHEFIVMRTADGDFDILSQEGKVNNLPFDRFVKYNGAFKCYGKSSLELIVMSDSVPSNVEEIQQFTLNNTVAIERLDSLYYWSNLESFQESELEETQQTGFWNLRETKSAQLNKMNWVDVIDMGYVGNVFAISSYRAHQVKIPFGPEMNVYYDGRIVDYSNKSDNATVQLISSTSTKTYYNTRVSWDNLEILPSGSQQWTHSNSNNSKIDANQVFDITFCLDLGFAATLADNVEWKENTESNFDLFAWWLSKNDFMNLHPTNETLPLVLNPKLKMVPSDTKVLLRSDSKSSKIKNSPYLNDTQYDEFLSLSTLWSSDQRMYLAKQHGSDTVLWFNEIKDSAVIKDYSKVKIKSNDFAITESVIKNYGYVHPSEPNFVFDPMDSMNANKEFVYGRLLVKSLDDTQLQSVNGCVLYKTENKLNVLNNGLFYVNEVQGIKIINRDGVETNNLSNGDLRILPNGNYLLQTADSIFWFSSDFHIQNTVPNGKVTAISGDRWLIERGIEKSIYESNGEFISSLQENEELSDNGWLFTKTKSGFSYRIPNNNKTLNVKVKPEETEHFLFNKQGSYYFVINDSGDEVVSKYKRLISKRECGQFTVLTGEKAFAVIDQFGVNVFNGEKLKSAEELDGVLFVETKDTVYEVNQSNALSRNKTKELSSEWKEGIESEVLLPAKQGAAFYYGTCIIPAIYDKVIPAGNQFFIVQSGKSYLTYSIGAGIVKAPMFKE